LKKTFWKFENLLTLQQNKKVGHFQKTVAETQQLLLKKIGQPQYRASGFGTGNLSVTNVTKTMVHG
jgi:hypothetical protein